MTDYSLRGAIATGMRAGARSKHIQPYCIRCGKMEDDFHLFFDCKFAQAVWFASPLGFKVEGLYNTVNTQIQDIIYYMLTSYKNEDAFQIVFSIVWSIWKARNDLLFSKKKCSPLQVLFQAKALQKEKKDDLTGYIKNLQADEDSKADKRANQNWKKAAKYPNIYTDAAWKAKDSSSCGEMHHKEKTGIGIHINCNWKDHNDIFVQASSNAFSAL